MRKVELILLALLFSGSIFARETPRDTARVNNLISAGFISLTKYNDLTEAKAYIDSAVNYCEKYNLEAPLKFHHLMAEYYFATGDYRSAERKGNELLEKAAEADDNDAQAKAMLFMGKYYLRTGFIRESLEYYNRLIDFARERKLKGMVPKGYAGLATTYMETDNIAEYRNNLKLMLDASRAENDSASLNIALSRLGTHMTIPPRDFRMADSLLKKSVKISLIMRDTFNASFSLANIGWNFYTEKMYDSSLFYYNKSLYHSIRANIFGVSANSLGNMGTIYRDLGDTEKAISYYKKAIDQAEKIKDIYTLSWVYSDMSSMYLMKNDTAKAYVNFVLFKKFSDSLLVQRNSQGMMNAKVRYEADTRNKEVELLSLRIKNQRILNSGIIGFIILTLALMVLLFNRTRIKSEQRISEMNRRISEVTQANLRQQMNPHFIFNTLNSIQYYMYQHDKLATNNYLTKFSSLMRKVLENSQHTSVRLQDELDALKLYLELESLRFKDKFDYKISIDEDIDTLVYKVPAMLIQPYVENSISHGLMPKEGKGYVKIDLRLQNNHILCSIEDNGIGREAAQEMKSKMNDTHNSYGTQITSSRLDLVNSLYGTSLKTTYTDLVNVSGEAGGTRVEIHIPLLS